VKLPPNDATTALLRAICLRFVPADPVVEEIRSRSWASATFVGARHDLRLRLRGDGARAAAELFSATLDARGFNLRGHILADISLVAIEPVKDGIRLRLQALTVEDA
jgi:hypothetical protein